jgi:predicted RNA-binding protein with PUA-like domain
MRYWLMKSEPSEVSIDDMLTAAESTLPWTGVRNYQARNFMRDAMQVGDGILFYHSSCARPGVAGLAVVASTPYPDPTQFDPHSPYFDAKATQQQPRWVSVDVRAVEKTPLLALAQLRTMSALEDMPLLKKGSRLSITPVAGSEWDVIVCELQRTQQGER